MLLLPGGRGSIIIFSRLLFTISKAYLVISEAYLTMSLVILAAKPAGSSIFSPASSKAWS